MRSFWSVIVSIATAGPGRWAEMDWNLIRFMDGRGHLTSWALVELMMSKVKVMAGYKRFRRWLYDWRFWESISKDVIKKLMKLWYKRNKWIIIWKDVRHVLSTGHVLWKWFLSLWRKKNKKEKESSEMWCERGGGMLASAPRDPERVEDKATFSSGLFHSTHISWGESRSVGRSWWDFHVQYLKCR